MARNASLRDKGEPCLASSLIRTDNVRCMSCNDPERCPIFVVGTGRSGTTLLRMMLNAHSRIYLTHEASFYLSTARLGRRATAAEWLARYRRTFSFAWLKLAEQELGDIAELQSAPMHRGFAMIMERKARQYGKVRYGDKTPLHTVHLASIRRDFPEARIIHIVRDPRATVASLIRMPWAPGSVGLNALYYEQQMKAVRRHEDSIHEILMEELLRDPERVMRGVLQYVGEEWDDAVLDHERHSPVDDVPPFPWFMSARRNVCPPKGPPSWRSDLSPAWIRIVESVTGRSMSGFGYETASLPREPGHRERFKARAREVPEAVRCISRLVGFARMGRRRKLPDPREGMMALLQLNPDAWRHYPDFEIPEIPSVPSPKYVG